MKARPRDFVSNVPVNLTPQQLGLYIYMHASFHQGCRNGF